MCKGFTRNLTRCRAVVRGGGDYCHNHSMDITETGLDMNDDNLGLICTGLRGRYFNRDGTILDIYLTRLTDEELRRVFYDAVMPFLRDCWSMGIPNSDLPQAVLRTHVAVLGTITQVELPRRVWTPARRIAEMTRRRNERGRFARPGAHREIFIDEAHIQDRFFAADFPPLPPGPPFGGGLPRANAMGGGLPPIAQDSQSVHRTSVNESVMESIKVLKAIPWKHKVWPIYHDETKKKFPGGRKLFEHIFLWSDIYTRQESKEMFPKLLPILEKNGISAITNSNEEVFGVKPWIVIYKTCQWAWERPVDEQREIFKRLLEESYEGRDMCIQGKVARYVNVLSGFHPDIRVGLSGKELLQDRMARLAQREGMKPEARMEEGRGILRDAAVPEAEWETWLEPLLLF
jgi:hypothetical protein